MVMDVLGQYPGLPGLFVACVFSASLRFVCVGGGGVYVSEWERGRERYREEKRESGREGDRKRKRERVGERERERG